MQANKLTEHAPLGTPLDRCRSYIVQQMEDRQSSVTRGALRGPGPAITLAHQTGAGAEEIAEQLATVLQKDEAEGTCHWTVFERQIVEKMLEEYHLPRGLVRLMPEDRRSFIKDVMEELVGLRPPSWVLVPQLAETVLHLANAGRVILLGRGANLITARLPNVFHVRLIAPLAKRLEHIQQMRHLDAEAAAKFIAQADRGRGRFVRAYFHSRIDDDLLYHLVVNTERIPYADVARLIAGAARRYFQAGGPALKD